MRFSLLISALTFVASVGPMTGCATSTEPAPPDLPLITSCESPRPQVCTMIFAPVCASRKDDNVETYASGCNACADDQVVSYLDGACEDEGSTL